MFFIFLNFFIILINFNYLSYNEDFLLNLFLILFFLILYILLKNKIKNFFFSYITKTFFVFIILMRFIYYYNNEYRIFNNLKSRFLNKFLLALRILKKNLSKILNQNYNKNLYLIRLLNFLKNLLDFRIIKDMNIIIIYIIKLKLKVHDILLFY